MPKPYLPDERLHWAGHNLAVNAAQRLQQRLWDTPEFRDYTTDEEFDQLFLRGRPPVLSAARWLSIYISLNDRIRVTDPYWIWLDGPDDGSPCPVPLPLKPLPTTDDNSR